MIDLKRLWRVKCIHSDFPVVFSKRFCSGITIEHAVKIPKRIERGPTDILRALAGTVQRDPTAQHYKIPDDPFFKAKSNMGIKLQALSIESGRKSARWIVQNNPQFFREKISEPFIKDFAPKEEYNENSEVGESTLESVIEENNVEDAMIIYKLLKDKNINVSNNVKQKLLELVCFYNCGEMQFNLKELENKWFQNAQQERLKSWKDGNFAEELFATMNEDCPLAYSALIQGMLKHGQVDRAIELKNEAADKNLTLSLGVYNEILAKVCNIKESNRWDYIVEVLNEMKSKKIKPDLYTLNAILHSLSGMRGLRTAASISDKLIAEFCKLNVKPSLGTYYYLIDMKCWRKYTRKENIVFLKQILRKLNSMEDLEARHPSDFCFFPMAMRISCAALKNVECAHAVHKLLTKGNNVKFLITNIDAHAFYNDYLTVSFLMEPVEYAMELFKSITPSILYPESKLLEIMVDVIGKNEAYKHLVPIRDVLSSQSDVTKGRIFSRMLNFAMLVNDEELSDVASVFVDAATLVYNSLTKNDQKFRPNEETVSNAIIALLRYGREAQAIGLAEMIMGEHKNYVLTPPALKLFFNTCISKGSWSLAKKCLKHAEETKQPDLGEIAKTALDNLPGLSEFETKWLTKLAAKHVGFSAEEKKQ